MAFAQFDDVNFGQLVPASPCMPLVGAAVIGQSGGPTAVINQSLVACIRAAKRHHPSITRVLGMRNGIKGLLNGDLVDLGAEAEGTLEAVRRTPAAALGSARERPTAEEVARILSALQDADVRYFFCIGGNGSAALAHVINTEAVRRGYEMRCFHIVKTIDNDLCMTDHCPGYGSACRFVAHGFQGDDRDLMSLGGCKINVCMGRDAGWLTAASVLGRRPDSDDGPHLIYVPERSFDLEVFVRDVQAIISRLGRCLVAVSEGICDAQGVPVLASLAGGGGELNAHGSVQFSGTGALGDALADVVKKRVGCRTRADTYGFLQRSFAADVSKVDADEAYMCGLKAVDVAVRGEVTSGSVVLGRGTGLPYMSKCNVVPLSSVAQGTRQMPEHFLEGRNNIAESFRTYAAPFVGDVEYMTDLALVSAPVFTERARNLASANRTEQRSRSPRNIRKEVCRCGVPIRQFPPPCLQLVAA